jgi:tyrosine-protein phosphatase YwqE
LHHDDQLLSELIERDVLLQININSLTGYYSKSVKKFVEKLIDKNCISFIGTDCHNIRHLDVIKEATLTRYFKKAASYYLLNHTL